MHPKNTPTSFQKTLLIFFVIFLAIILFPSQNTLARFAWNVTANERVVAAVGSYDGALYKSIGDHFISGGAYDRAKALRAYETARALDAELPGVNFQIARIHFLNGFFTQALMEARKEEKIAPNDVRTDYLLGLIYGYRDYAGDLEKAAGYFARFLAANPYEWAGYNDLAWVYLKGKKIETARAAVLTAFDTLPHTRKTNPWLWTTLGIAELNLKEHNKAKEAFENAARIAEEMSPDAFWSAYPGNNPRNAAAAFGQFKSSLYFNLGVAHEGLGEIEKAIDAYSRHIASAPDASPRHTQDVARKIQTLRISTER
ncbi:MAG: tetratricopeptide repeat protein [Parcubacteria group bacterium]|nr:tetratricopeptide repeat protein [Parcubacteria group bacterium]